MEPPDSAEITPFTAQTRRSGVATGTRMVKKGAVDAIRKAHPDLAATAAELRRITDEIARAGDTPLAVVEHDRLMTGSAARMPANVEPGSHALLDGPRRPGSFAVVTYR